MNAFTNINSASVSDNVSGAGWAQQTGVITACIAAGVPPELVIPLLPVTENFGGKGRGKAPAVFDPVTGRWEGLDNWERGGHDPDTILRLADAAGGNCGLIIGVPAAGGFQFLADDIDLMPGPNAVKCRNGFLS